MSKNQQIPLPMFLDLELLYQMQNGKSITKSSISLPMHINVVSVFTRRLRNGRTEQVDCIKLLVVCER